MSDKSHIEWTESTWNPVTGCTKVSQGCKHCYAKHQAWPRLKASPQTVYFGREFEDVQCHPERLDQPLRWTKPRRIFVNSMSDLFHEAVPESFIDSVWAVMALAPHHTYQILTKRPERMRNYLTHPERYQRVLRAADPFRQMRPKLGGIGISDPASPAWWRQVWLGVSVEDQATADERIPLLLDTPAAVRWISAEPLLGPVDLTRWVRPIAMMEPVKAPATWSEWNAGGLWPDWVPERWRHNIESFWADDWRRGPRAWLQSAIDQNAAPHGAIMTSTDPLVGKGPVTGRFLHTWNNMCVLVDEAGEAHVTSTPHAGLIDFNAPKSSSYQGVQWVVVGGESGPNARPTVIGHVREIVQQCKAAGVPVLVKQLGARPTNREGMPHPLKDRKGGDISEFPEDIRIREYPA
jgi:protein gp37